MKKIQTIVLFTTAILQSHAGQAIYKSIGHQAYYGNYQTQNVTAKGYWIFDPDTQRGTAIVGIAASTRKIFTVVPLENYRIEHVTAANGVSYTVIAKAESPGTQFAGTILESVYLRGRDSAVTIDSQGSRVLPRTFTATARAISKNTQTGVTIAGEVTGSYTLDIKASQVSSASETFDEAVTRLGNWFVSQGYTQYTAPPAP